MIAAKCSVGIALKVPFLFVGMLLVIRIFGVGFGRVTTAILKLLAIAMTVQAVDFFIEAVMAILAEGLPLMGMDIYVRFPFVIVTFFALAMKLFELDLVETVVLFLSTYMLPTFLAFFCMMWVYTMLT